MESVQGIKSFYLTLPERQHLQTTLNPELFPDFLCHRYGGFAVFCNPVRKITVNTVTDLICSNDDTPPMGKRMPIGFLGYQRNE